MLFQQLAYQLDGVLQKITRDQLSRYDYLQRTLHATNVATDARYQQHFVGYYRIRRNKVWRVIYFSMLQREKLNVSVTFRNILQEIYASTGRVEPSFSSKLVATIQPEMPVYDKFVRQNLSLQIPSPRARAEIRITKFSEVYSTLSARIAELIGDNAFAAVKQRFDTKFPEYAHFTDTKKLDLVLWQLR